VSYFQVGTKDDSLAFYVWADNPQHALRKVEAHFDMAFPPQRVTAQSVTAEAIPDGDDVIDEPKTEKESRTDGMEV
jgi:hypothetical protein